MNEVPNPATVLVGGTVTTEPRRGRNDKQPWNSLELTNLYGNTIEDDHLFDVYLGESLVPYRTLSPLKTVLPLKLSGRQFVEEFWFERRDRPEIFGTTDATAMDADQSSLGRQ